MVHYIVRNFSVLSSAHHSYLLDVMPRVPLKRIRVSYTEPIGTFVALSHSMVTQLNSVLVCDLMTADEF